MIATKTVTPRERLRRLVLDGATADEAIAQAMGEIIRRAVDAGRPL